MIIAYHTGGIKSIVKRQQKTNLIFVQKIAITMNILPIIEKNIYRSEVIAMENKNYKSSNQSSNQSSNKTGNQSSNKTNNQNSNKTGTQSSNKKDENCK